MNENPNKPVYGVVTDANLWQFGKLIDNIFFKDPENFTIDDLGKVYGALECLFEFAEKDDIQYCS